MEPQEAAPGAEAPSDYADHMAEMAALLDISDPPKTTPIRVITASEYETVMQACLSDKGFEVKLPAGGGFDIQLPNDQVPAFRLAHYECEGMFPVHELYRREAGPEEQRREYQWLTTVLVPCLNDEGIDINEPPTLESFQSAYDRPTRWHPVNELLESLGAARVGELSQTCPLDPPAEVIFGEP